MPAKARENLFAAFRGSARAGGTGLGLAIARELVLAHGGTLELREDRDFGVHFEICLPDAPVSLEQERVRRNQVKEPGRLVLTAASPHPHWQFRRCAPIFIFPVETGLNSDPQRTTKPLRRERRPWTATTAIAMRARSSAG